MKIILNETQLSDLNQNFNWWVEQTDENNRIIGLGGKWRFAGINNRVEQLNKRAQLENKNILELGCLDGSVTVSLCAVNARVTAVDIRPLNLIKTFARCIAFGYNPILYIKDIRDIKGIIELGKFDILCHFGCFYHLYNPIEHFRQLSAITNIVALETHTGCPHEKWKINREEQVEGYKGVFVKEHGWKDELSGLDLESFWLHKSELLRLFTDCGWRYEIIWDNDNSINGPRSYYLLTR